MAAGQNNLSPAVTPQTQAALQQLMQQEMAMKLQDRQANLQLKMQEKHLDDSFQDRQHQRKLQQEQMKFQNSAAGQSRQHEQQMQEKQLKAQQEQWDKYNAVQERMQAAANAAREKAAKLDYDNQLRYQQLSAKLAGAKKDAQKPYIDKINTLKEKMDAQALARSNADISYQLRQGNRAAEMRVALTKAKEATQHQIDFLNKGATESSAALSSLAQRLRSPLGEATLLNPENPGSYWGEISQFISGVDTGHLQSHLGHELQTPGGLSDRPWLGLIPGAGTLAGIGEGLADITGGLLPDQPAEASAREGTAVGLDVADELAKSLASAYGSDSKTMKDFLVTLVSAGHDLASDLPGAQESAKKKLNGFLTHRGDAAKFSNFTMSSVAGVIKEWAQSQLDGGGDLPGINEELIRLKTDGQNANPGRDIDKDYTNREYQRFKSLEAVLDIFSRSDAVLKASGVWADAETNGKHLSSILDTLEKTADPAERARLATENRSQFADYLGMQPSDFDVFAEYNRDAAERDAYVLRSDNAKAQLTLDLEKQAAEAARAGQGDPNLEYNLLQELMNANH